MQFSGTWELVLNSDSGEFEGADNPLADALTSISFPWDGYEHSLQAHIPAMSAQWYRFCPDEAKKQPKGNKGTEPKSGKSTKK